MLLQASWPSRTPQTEHQQLIKITALPATPITAMVQSQVTGNAGAQANVQYYNAPALTQLALDRTMRWAYASQAKISGRNNAATGDAYLAMLSTG